MKEIILSKGLVALVDNSDFEWLNQWKWYAQKNGKTYYAIRTDKEMGKILMHRLILAINNSGIIGDHIDCNGLNNQRNNLRLANKSENLCNTGIKTKGSSLYKGVCLTKEKTKWQAHIQKDGKQKYLGVFETQEAAAIAYNKAAAELHGEFASLNKI